MLEKDACNVAENVCQRGRLVNRESSGELPGISVFQDVLSYNLSFFHDNRQRVLFNKRRRSGSFRNNVLFFTMRVLAWACSVIRSVKM